MTLPLSLLGDNWFAAATSRELRDKPLARTIIGLPLVLFRTRSGIGALLDRCPHRNVALSLGTVDGDSIRCSYHGWKFAPGGKCEDIPGMSAPSVLPDDAHRSCSSECQSSSGSVEEKSFAPSCNAYPFAASEHHGLIFVFIPQESFQAILPITPARRGSNSSLSLKDLPAPHHSFAPKAEFDSFLWCTNADCNFVDGMENLLDATHPAFVHSFLVRTASKRKSVALRVMRHENMVEAIYSENSQAAGLIPRLFEGLRTESIGRYVPPTTAQLEYRGPKGVQFVLTAMFTPIDERSCRIYADIATPKGIVPAYIKEAVLRLAFTSVVKQDLDILRQQRQNIERFGAANFVSTPIDVMRPHILYFLQRKNSEGPVLPFEKALSMDL